MRNDGDAGLTAVAPHFSRLARPKHRFLSMGKPMPIARYMISPSDLWNLIGTAQSPPIVDNWSAKVA
jgi:hypothetical protein